MSKAAQTPTRATPDISTPTEPLAAIEKVSVTSLPSIHDIGRRIAALYVVHDRCDEDNIRVDGLAAKHRASVGMDITFAQIDSLQELVCTMPAVTLADAAVQVATALTVADRIDGAIGCERELSQLEAKLDRMLLSTLPIIAEAAGLSMEEMGWSDLVSLRKHRFEALEAVR